MDMQAHFRTATVDRLPVEWNFNFTGGSFGRVRKLPGFTIRKNDAGRFYVTCDRTGQTVSGGHESPESAEHGNAFRKPRIMGN